MPERSGRDLGDLMVERAHKRAAEQGCTFDEALEYVKNWFFGKFHADKMLAESFGCDEAEGDPPPIA
jgi:hypothetical protein